MNEEDMARCDAIAQRCLDQFRDDLTEILQQPADGVVTPSTDRVRRAGFTPSRHEGRYPPYFAVNIEVNHATLYLRDSAHGEKPGHLASLTLPHEALSSLFAEIEAILVDLQQTRVMH